MEQTDENQDVAPLRIFKNKMTEQVNWGAWLVASVAILGYLLLAQGWDKLNSGALVLLVLALLAAAYSIWRLVLVTSSGGVYTFDRDHDSLSLDGKQIAHLSDIKTVLIKQMRTFGVDIVYKSGSSTRLGTYPRAEQAVAVAQQIADYTKVETTEGWGLF